jgi:hypothetical protein
MAARDAEVAAQGWAALAARKLLANRTGHGGGRVVYRQMSEAQLYALAMVAFEAGAAWAREQD